MPDTCRIEDASTQLCAAADAGDMRQLTRLAENGVDVNAQDYDGRTALHIAARNGTLSAVEFLVSHKADINATDRYHSSPETSTSLMAAGFASRLCPSALAQLQLSADLAITLSAGT